MKGSRYTQPSGPARRPDQHERVTHHVTDGHSTVRSVRHVVPGVGGVPAVVAHHPDPAHRNFHVKRDGGRPRAGEEVAGLVQRHAVDRDPALRVAARDLVPRHPDHALDQVVLVARGQQADEREHVLDAAHDGIVRGRGRGALQPAAGVVEDHDLAALRLRAEPRGELVHQHPVAGHDRVLHRLGRDEERLHHEGLDAEGEQQRDAEQDGDLPPQPDRLEPASPPLTHAGPPVASHRAARWCHQPRRLPIPPEERRAPPIPEGTEGDTGKVVRRFRTAGGYREYSTFSLIFAFLPRRSRR